MDARIVDPPHYALVALGDAQERMHDAGFTGSGSFQSGWNNARSIQAMSIFRFRAAASAWLVSW